MNGSTKDQLAYVVRLFALSSGGYHQRHGDVPQDTLLSRVKAKTVIEEAEAQLVHGTQNLLSAFGEVMGGD